MREGFATGFLPEAIELPELTETSRKAAYVVNGSEVIKYTHFSLALDKNRGFAIWVGWNVDGGSIKKLSRKGIPFIVDPEIPIEFQVGDELYDRNRLDRGHVARRADLVWGEFGEAEQANMDSFYFTNITPQMDDFNQSIKGGLWGRLEDAVFDDASVDSLRISVFGGPVFRDNDRIYKNVKIPREYWKVIVFVEDGKLKAKAFLLTQNLNDLEVLELDEFRVYQVALTEIENRCALRFSASLKAADSVGDNLNQKELSSRSPLESVEDIDWS